VAIATRMTSPGSLHRDEFPPCAGPPTQAKRSHAGPRHYLMAVFSMHSVMLRGCAASGLRCSHHRAATVARWQHILRWPARTSSCNRSMPDTRRFPVQTRLRPPTRLLGENRLAVRCLSDGLLVEREPTWQVGAGATSPSRLPRGYRSHVGNRESGGQTLAGGYGGHPRLEPVGSAAADDEVTGIVALVVAESEGQSRDRLTLKRTIRGCKIADASAASSR
jgi:hypothetical protein